MAGNPPAGHQAGASDPSSSGRVRVAVIITAPPLPPHADMQGTPRTTALRAWRVPPSDDADLQSSLGVPEAETTAAPMPRSQQDLQAGGQQHEARPEQHVSVSGAAHAPPAVRSAQQGG